VIAKGEDRDRNIVDFPVFGLGMTEKVFTVPCLVELEHLLEEVADHGTAVEGIDLDRHAGIELDGMGYDHNRRPGLDPHAVEEFDETGDLLLVRICYLHL
jgi:hypothetical protein